MKYILNILKNKLTSIRTWMKKNLLNLKKILGI